MFGIFVMTGSLASIVLLAVVALAAFTRAAVSNRRGEPVGIWVAVGLILAAAAHAEWLVRTAAG